MQPYNANFQFAKRSEAIRKICVDDHPYKRAPKVPLTYVRMVFGRFVLKTGVTLGYYITTDTNLSVSAWKCEKSMKCFESHLALSNFFLSYFIISLVYIL